MSTAHECPCGGGQLVAVEERRNSGLLCDPSSRQDQAPGQVTVVTHYEPCGHQVVEA